MIRKLITEEENILLLQGWKERKTDRKVNRSLVELETLESRC
jgi:hypothetical protein